MAYGAQVANTSDNTPVINSGVRTQHDDYVAMAPKWLRCRDVAGGADAVHAAKTLYLPMLKDQASADYEAYVTRATFYNASWRTIIGLVGMMFRKPPKIVVPKALRPLLDDVTLGNESLHVFAQNVAEEALTIGRLGILVDYPPVGTQTLTAADAAALNLRPTLCIYKAESIINWRRRVILNANVLALVVLVEQATISDDEFSIKTETRYRVLDLDPNGEYRVRIFRVNDKGRDQQVGNDVYPLMNGKRLKFIPFVFLGVDSTGSEVDEPSLIDLFDMNLAHYRVSADYETGCHFAGLPTAVVSGYAKDNPSEQLYVGSSTAWVFPDPATRVSYLEFSGNGLKTLESNLDRKERQMAVLGARMLEELKRGIESAQTAAIHRVGEESVLSAIAQSVSIGITQALRWFAQWAGIAGDATIDLNRDFFPVPMTDAMLTALIAGWQQGAYSYATLFDNLKQGEIIAPDATPDTEQAKIGEQAPVLHPGLPLPTQPVVARSAAEVNAG